MKGSCTSEDSRFMCMPASEQQAGGRSHLSTVLLQDLFAAPFGGASGCESISGYRLPGVAANQRATPGVI